MKQQLVKLLFFLIGISSFMNATIYSNGDNNDSNQWHVYDNSPLGATVSNITDSFQGNVISFTGNGIDNGYRLGTISDNSEEAWHNDSEFTLKWKMKYNETFLIFVSIETTQGHKYLTYSPHNYNAGSGHGLGTDVIDGTWKSFSRNLVSDLNDINSSNTLLKVNGFLIRGSGLIDDIELINENNESYLQNLILPSCDSSNPEVQIINENIDWEHINDSDKTIFCVSPGDYSDISPISIDINGTSTKLRYILLNNGNNEHPVNLDYTDLAKSRLEFHSSDYWVVDRLAYWEDENPHNKMIVLENSSHNIFNRILGKDVASGISFYTGSDDNVIQNSHMEKTQWSVDFAVNERNESNRTSGLPHYNKRIFADTAAFQLVGANPNESLKNNIITHNEVINFIDAVQLVRKDNAEYNASIHGTINPRLNGEGTIIEDNNFYVTPLVYTDGHGNFIHDGNKSVTENALDFKFGSLNRNNPVIVKNNVMFGYRPVDNTYGSLSDNGNAMVFHFGARDIIVEKNYIFDSNKGFAIGGPRGDEQGAYNLTFRDNIFYKLPGAGVYMEGPHGDKNTTLFLTAKNILIQHNIFAKAGTDHKEIYLNSSLHIYNTEGVTIDNNSFIDSSQMYFAAMHGKNYASKDLNITNNKFYGTSVLQSKEESNSIPDSATYTGNTKEDESFNWDSYKNKFLIQRFSNGGFVYKIMREE